MSIYTQRSGATQHPEYMLDFLMNTVIDVSGVSKLGDSNLQVAQQASPNMSVKIGMGDAFIRKTDGSKIYPVRIGDTTETLSISANGSGNSRIDAVILYVDLSASPNITASNVAKLTVVEGTPAGSPVAPTDGDITTAIGASNPFIRLANVTVASGASQILTANIADTRVRATRVKRHADYYTLSDGATVSIDYEDGAKQKVTLGGNRTLAEPTNMQVGDELWLKIIQDATGNRVPTWWTTFKWADGVEPVLTGDANGIDIIGIVKTGSATYEGGTVWGALA